MEAAAEQTLRDVGTVEAADIGGGSVICGWWRRSRQSLAPRSLGLCAAAGVAVAALAVGLLWSQGGRSFERLAEVPN